MQYDTYLSYSKYKYKAHVTCKWHFFMGLSIALHVTLYALLPAPKPWITPPAQESHLHIDLIQLPKDTKPAPLKQVFIRKTKPEASSQWTDMQASSTKVNTPKESMKAEIPPRSIMYQDSFQPRNSKLWPESFTVPSTQKNSADPSGIETAKRNLNDLAKQFAHQKNYTHKQTVGWGTLAAKTAQDGAAFYAATASGNVPAMIAVTGLSLSSGALRHTFSKFKKRTSQIQTLTDKEAKLLAHLEQFAPITAPKLYQLHSKGWTYKTMQKTLDSFVSKGKVHRLGRSHHAIYTIEN